jgi:hypothetical protein
MDIFVLEALKSAERHPCRGYDDFVATDRTFLSLTEGKGIMLAMKRGSDEEIQIPRGTTPTLTESQFTGGEFLITTRFPMNSDQQRLFSFHRKAAAEVASTDLTKP